VTDGNAAQDGCSSITSEHRTDSVTPDNRSFGHASAQLDVSVHINHKTLPDLKKKKLAGFLSSLGSPGTCGCDRARPLLWAPNPSSRLGDPPPPNPASRRANRSIPSEEERTGDGHCLLLPLRRLGSSAPAGPRGEKGALLQRRSQRRGLHLQGTQLAVLKFSSSPVSLNWISLEMPSAL
jgi:hypothetical protein